MMIAHARFNIWRPITPSDTVNFNGSTGPGAPTCDAIKVGGAGVVRAVMQDGTPGDLTVVAGETLWIAAIRVMSTGTTATPLAALYEV